MQLSRAFFYCWLVLLNFISAAVSTFDGYLKVYSGVYYSDPIMTINFNYPNRCYHMSSCTRLNNKIASAKWTNLPTTGTIGNAYIAFYSDAECKSSSTKIQLPHNGGVREFDGQKVEGNISSFMVLTDSRTIQNGWTNVCDWVGIGSNDVVEEDPTLAVFF